jgi:hypothetical protein
VYWQGWKEHKEKMKTNVAARKNVKEIVTDG